MRILLPDVSVLIALHDTSHRFYALAHEWLSSIKQNPWATCPLTENGFVRLHTQTFFLNQPNGVYEAFFVLENLKQAHETTHQFWADGISLSDAEIFIPSKIAGPKQITDVYLLGLCQKYEGTLVTFDTRMTTNAIVAPHADLLRILQTP